MIGFSLPTVLDVTAGPFFFPRLPVGNAVLPPMVEHWYPGGSAMDTLTYPVFSDVTAEFTALQNGQIDFPDSPLYPFLPLNNVCFSPNFLCTNPISASVYYELEFNMANNYWGCSFNFGNTACGIDIRQAFAHGLDKNQFVVIELGGTSNAQAVDNPVPPSVTLNSPNPCSWDTTHPEAGFNCVVNGPGGTAYHLAGSSPGSGCTNTPQFAYTPGCGTPDFCAAADHLIAAGIANGKNPSTCVLTGVAPAVSSSPIQLFIRNDDTPRLHAGQAYGQFICALLTGSFSNGCPGVAETFGPVSGFCGFLTSLSGLNTCWWVYTAGFESVLTFDVSLYNIYDSRFVDGISSVKPPCSNPAVPTTNPSNYLWLCSPTYDSKIEQAEFAPCATAGGDPVSGQTIPTFANCPATSQLSSASAAYQAQDYFGQNAFTIPLYSPVETFAYLNGWTRAVVHNTEGFTPPGNYFLTLDAFNPAPAVPGTIRQGYSQTTSSSNPFVMQNLPQDEGVVNSIYDSPGRTNPSAPQNYMDWMTYRTDQLKVPSNLGYTPPAGTVGAFRYLLRPDIFWQTGQRLTAWDAAFSYVAYRVNGVRPGLSVMTGVKVLSATQFDIDVSSFGPYTKLNLSNPVIPGRDWVNSGVCTPSAWDSAANTMDFQSANRVLTSCIAPSSAVTPSGVITPTGSNVDSAKVSPTFDPVAAGILIGSGPWVCQSSTGIVGTGCTPGNNSSPAPGGAWTFQRFGKGRAPATSVTGSYFRSSGDIALWAWSGNNGREDTTDFLNMSMAVFCFGKPVNTSGCTRWQEGIGNPDGPAPIGLSQVSIIVRFYGLNWVSPFDWVNNPPQNIAGPFSYNNAMNTIVLHEGTVTLNPASIASCTNSYNNGGGYDC